MLQYLGDSDRPLNQGDGAAQPAPSSITTPTAQELDWTRISDHHRYALAQQRQRQVLTKLGAMLDFVVDPAKVGTVERMDFVFRLRLAIWGTAIWDDMESLIHTTSQEFPVT